MRSNNLNGGMRYPGNGMPKVASSEPGGDRAPDHPFAFLAKNRQIGKRVVLPFITPVGLHPSSSVQTQPAPLSILNLQGADQDTTQICVVLSEPKYIPSISSITELANGGDIQRLTGEQDNIDLAGTSSNCGGAVRGGTADVQIGNPVAVLEWGAGGVSSRAEIDFHNGLAINVVASWLRLLAFVESPTVQVGSFPYVLAGFVGPGTPKPNNAQRTMPLGTIDIDTAGNVFTVPRFAKSVMLCGGNQAGDAYTATIRFWRSTSGPADYSSVPVAAFLFAANAANAIPVPVPNGAYYFDVVSGIDAVVDGNPGVLNSHQAIFDLTI
jgi:hypothetical protein